jgi:hypothetical protein
MVRSADAARRSNWSGPSPASPRNAGVGSGPEFPKGCNTSSTMIFIGQGNATSIAATKITSSAPPPIAQAWGVIARRKRQNVRNMCPPKIDLRHPRRAVPPSCRAEPEHFIRPCRKPARMWAGTPSIPSGASLVRSNIHEGAWGKRCQSLGKSCLGLNSPPN